MEEIIKRIKLDINAESSQQIVFLRHMESGRRVEFILNQSGVPYYVENDGKSAQVHVKRPNSETPYFKDAEISNGRILFTISTGVTGEVGTVDAELHIIGSSEEHLITAPFKFEVSDTIAAEDDSELDDIPVSELTQLISDANNAISAANASVIKDAEVIKTENGGEPAAAVELVPGENGQTLKLFLENIDGKDGYTPIKGVDYVDGKDGYTPVKGVDYVDGKDGVSPEIRISKTGQRLNLTVIDVNGESETYFVYDGIQGRPGEDGDDGISPTVKLSKDNGVTTLSITDRNGTKTVEILDGEKGDKGENGDSPVVIEGKMEKENPSGYGSISVNRKADSEIGEFSVAIGKDNIASGYASYAEGRNNEASDKYAHAEGYGCIASGEHAHAEGRDTVASGIHSHAEGCGCKASRAVTHAEGWYTFAFGQYSHVEGDSSETRGNTSHAEGLYTQANGSYQHVQGKYNIADDSDKYAHIVGNGTDVNNRSNAHTLDWQGNAWFSGQVFMGGTGMDDPRAMKLGSGGYVIHVPAEEASIDEETGEVTLTLTESRDNFGPVLEAGGTVWLDLSATPMAEMLGMPSLSLSVMMWAYVEGMGLILLSSTPMFNVMANVQNGTWTPGGTT